MVAVSRLRCPAAAGRRSRRCTLADIAGRFLGYGLQRRPSLRAQRRLSCLRHEVCGRVG